MEYPNKSLAFQINNNLFLIRLLNLGKLNLANIPRLVDICGQAFSEANIGNIKIIINIAPLDEDFDDYTFFIRLSCGYMIYSTILVKNNNVLVNLEQFLTGLVIKINEVVEELSEGEEYDDPHELDNNPIPPETNVEDLVREIAIDIKHRKK